MGQQYGANFSIAGVNAVDGVLFNLKAAATLRPRILQVGFFISTAPTNAPQFGIKRMNAVGTGTITTATTFLFDPAEAAATAALETAWTTTRPTVTGGTPITGAMPTAIGNGVVFDFTGRPIVVATSGGVCGVMLNATGATVGNLIGYVLWEE